MGEITKCFGVYAKGNNAFLQVFQMGKLTVCVPLDVWSSLVSQIFAPSKCDMEKRKLHELKCPLKHFTGFFLLSYFIVSGKD